MKKFISLILASAIILTAFTGCTAKTSDTGVTDDATNTAIVEELPDGPSREEVWSWFHENLDPENPSISVKGGTFYLENGNIEFDADSYQSPYNTNYFGSVHVPPELSEKEGVETLHHADNFTAIRDGDTVSIWRYGELRAQFELTSTTVYCGRSAWEGLIFRDGDEVWALHGPYISYGNSGAFNLVVIARGVEAVITANYDLGSDPWSQPLFLMEDGTLRAYQRWSNSELPVDSPENLQEVRVEGGYHGGFHNPD